MIEQLNFFDIYPHGSPEEIILSDGHLQLYHSIFSDAQASSHYNQLEREICWQQDSITLFGKSQPLPRLTAWYGDPERSYTYSGIAMEPTPWTPLLQTIKTKVETLAKATFNSVLLNFYRTGEDGVSWHADDEPELKKNYPIASVSFGGTRRFLLKHKTDSTIDKVELMLTSGSVLLMLDAT
ncbi:alpha-ketoglutarate-dependent dioxygenase AlkB [Synechocystis sp. PCC 7339]|uniref:alpha-ketoglutarate-dependent dioxygenase AlkB family protein n=1 Tax=Synechocystis sp. PCC 7339 TaxID=2782213 RepID=UPI001CC0A138